MVTGRGQNGIKAAENGKGQDDSTVFGWLEIASQEIGNLPDHGRQRSGMFCCVHEESSSIRS